MILFLFLAATLPAIDCTTSPVCAKPVDLAGYEKVPTPGVEMRENIASATRSPWVNSNVWRFARLKGRPVFYAAQKGQAILSMAEAFAWDVEARVRPDPADLDKVSAMLAFLKHAGAGPSTVLANIGFMDDGSAQAGEAMNLLARRNLLFRVVAAPDPNLDLNIRPTADSNASEFAAMVRAKLTDEKRLLRVYGSDVVLGRLTGDASKARLHLVNYGGRKIEGLRVRVRGHYKTAGLRTAGSSEAAGDIVVSGGAIELSIPSMETYAVVDLR